MLGKFLSGYDWLRVWWKQRVKNDDLDRHMSHAHSHPLTDVIAVHCLRCPEHVLPIPGDRLPVRSIFAPARLKEATWRSDYDVEVWSWFWFSPRLMLSDFSVWTQETRIVVDWRHWRVSPMAPKLMARMLCGLSLELVHLKIEQKISIRITMTAHRTRFFLLFIILPFYHSVYVQFSLKVITLVPRLSSSQCKISESCRQVSCAFHCIFINKRATVSFWSLLLLATLVETFKFWCSR